jgi:deoxycytidine triphosphate deaminase
MREEELMSVIPFVTDGDYKTVVTNREEFNRLDGLDGQAILIENFDDQQNNPTSGNASYDLRVGDEYRDHRDVGKTELPAGDNIILHPGSAVIIETSEYVHFPKTRFGHIVPRVSLLQKGISNTSSKIDPGYHGKLLVTVFNLGKTKVELKKGAPFCTLYVLNVKSGVKVYEKQAKRIVGAAKRGRLRIMRDFVETNQTYFTVILTISTIVLVLATIVLTIFLIREVKGH